MSPFAGKRFPSLASFTADVRKLGEALHANDLRLVGGEPLLNPEINAFIKVAKDSGIADTVMVTTNGLLLHRMDDEFWRSVDFVSVTLYPEALPQEKNLAIAKERARESNTRLRLFPSDQFRTTMLTEPGPDDWVTKMIYRTCKNAHRYHCHMIHEGRLYKCAVPPFLPDYLDKLGMGGYDPAGDAFSLHADNIYDGLREFLLSTKTMEACRFCLGHVGRFQSHHQLSSDMVAQPGLQRITRRTHLDRFKFLKETIRYGRRRVMESVTGKQRW